MPLSLVLFSPFSRLHPSILASLLDSAKVNGSRVLRDKVMNLFFLAQEQIFGRTPGDTWQFLTTLGITPCRSPGSDGFVFRQVEGDQLRQVMGPF